MKRPGRLWFNRNHRILLVIAAVLLGSLFTQWWHTPAYGAVLGDRAFQLANDEASTTTTAELSFVLATAGPLGSIDVQFCSNDPFPGTACDAPAGFSMSGATLTAQTGATGFSISPASTPNEVILTRTAAAATVTSVAYDFDHVVNPSAPGAYYVRLQTFASEDATGQVTDAGGIAFDITNQLAISAEVPPYLIFCTAITIGGLNCANAQGNYVDFGELSTHHTGSGTSQMLVATNAEAGYNVTVSGTTLTSGNNVISALTTNDVVRPGVGQFGLNLRSNSAPSVGNNPIGPGVGQPQSNYDQANSFRFNPGDTIISVHNPDNVRVYTASYVVNVSSNQAPGIYVSTLTYVCLADF
ncbi:MAG TPA: hypothetical protein VG992_02760 [Candidatus Saccharimonadales bacterium]|nr:hypothetical protein [Candidatus Saccharimonadales bacterium]